MTKKERAARYQELITRSPRDLAEVILQAEDGIDRRNKQLAKARETHRSLLREAADVLEAVMSSDPDMPSHEQTMRDAEEMLERLRGAP